MKLYLVQHGEASAKEVDPDRPLTEKGKADIENLAAFLDNSGVHVDRVIHSGKLRARQTAQGLANTIAPGVELETSDIINPNDNPKAFDWQSDSWNRDTLVVGHLPFMAKLVSHLVLDDMDTLITAYQPGSMVCLEQDNDSHWLIIWMLRPDIVG